jgi:Bacterial Ig domain
MKLSAEFCVFAFLLFVLSILLIAVAPTLCAATIPSTAGWFDISNTHLRSVCPPDNFGGSGYAFTFNCYNVIGAWNGGVFDTARNRLIIWGGGHHDYSGNEVYALDLNTLALSRLTDPGLPVATDPACPESLVNGTQPNSRHTYGGIAYMPNVDKMFVFGGALATCGFASRGTWTFNFATNQWETHNPSGPLPNNNLGIVSAYDPNSGKVFLHDSLDLYSYSPITDSYQKLTNNNSGIDNHLTATIDPKRKKFVILGATQAWIYDISGSTFTLQALSTTGGSAIINSDFPGLAYDPQQDRIVAWSGGNNVYELNLDTNMWSSVSFAGGPAAGPMGVFGHWQYSPASDVYVTINSADADAYLLRLNPSPPPPPPTVSMTAPAFGSTVSGTTTVSATASDNAGIAGVQFKLDGVNLGAEVTSAPYAIRWDTTTVTNASHTLTAVARDTAGNTATANRVTVQVFNSPFRQAAGLSNDTNGSTIAAVFSTTTIGNLIVAAVTWGDSSSLTCSDSQGNAYVTLPAQYDNTNAQSLGICYASNIKGGAVTVTASFSGSPNYRRILIHEYSGIVTGNPVDVTAANLANGTTSTDGVTSTTATATTSDLIFGAVMDDSGTFTSVQAGTNFTLRGSLNGTDLATEDQLQTQSGSTAATWTFGRADRYLAQMVAFKLIH